MSVTAIDAVDLRRLRWRCRRGLLECDLLIDRFFRRQDVLGETLTTRQAEGLTALMDLSDPDLLDLLLARREPQGDLDCTDVRDVLALLRTAAARPAATSH